MRSAASCGQPLQDSAGPRGARMGAEGLVVGAAVSVIEGVVRAPSRRRLCRRHLTVPPAAAQPGGARPRGNARPPLPAPSPAARLALMSERVPLPPAQDAMPTTRGMNFYLEDANLEFVCAAVMDAATFARA